MRKTLWVVGAALTTLACGDSSGPKQEHHAPGLTLVSGFALTDTVTAHPTTPLVVEVRDPAGNIVPQGTVVRFTGVPAPQFEREMLVQSLISEAFSGFATGQTDAAGRAAVLVEFGTKPGPARIAIQVPTLGVEDTARYTVLPGRPAFVGLTPDDTVMYTGHTYTLHGTVYDRFANVRLDPITYSASASGVSVSSAGVVSATVIGRYTIIGSAGPGAGSAAISVVPQGTIAAVKIASPFLRIISVGLDGSGFRDLTDVVDGGIGPQPKWIPGTNTIIYSHYDGTIQQLRTVDQNGTVAPFLSNRPLTMSHQAEPSPSFSAPFLYFSAYDSRCSVNYYCLHRSQIDGTGAELLGLAAAPGQESQRPAASPDGSKVAFVTSGPIIKVFTYASKTVSAWSVIGEHPSWSPDGSQIAYVTELPGPLRVMNSDGTNPHIIGDVDRPYANEAISWSSDSKWILARQQAHELELVEVATGRVLPLRFTEPYAGGSLK